MTRPFQPLDIDLATLSHAYGQVPGRISAQGGEVAAARLAYQRAEHERKREEALCYQLARVELEQARGAKGKAPTEAQVDAHMRTDPALSARLLAACEAEWVAEAAYEVARSNYKAVVTEGDMVAEAARDRREEMRQIDPTLRLPAPAARPPVAGFDPGGLSWPAPQVAEGAPWHELPVVRGTVCAECGEPVRMSPSGSVCQRGHGGVGVRPANPPPL